MGLSATVDTSETVLECIALTKRFGGLTAVDSMSMDLRRGEVLALVGDNGAGKSTMVQIISGEYHPDEGSIVLDGQPVSFSTPMDARHMGIETIYQDLALCENLDAAGNIFLGQELRTRTLGLLPSLDRQTMRAESGKSFANSTSPIPDTQAADPPIVGRPTASRGHLPGCLLEGAGHDHGRTDRGTRCT